MSQTDRHEQRTPPLAMRLATAIVIWVGSSYFVMLLDMVRAVLLMRLLGPTGRGITRGVNLLTSYLDNTHLGVRHGVSKRLPQAIAADDAQAADAVEDVGFTSILIISIVTAVGVLIWAAVSRELQATTAISVALGGALLLGQQADGLYQVVLRAFGGFRVLAKARVVFGFAQFVGMVCGAWRAGVVGAMVGWVASYLALLLYYHCASSWHARLKFRWDVCWRLIAVGIPISAMTLSDVLLRSVEGIVVAKYYKVYGLGLYGTATQMAGYLYAIAQAAQFVIWPRVLDCHIRDGMGDETCRNVVLPTVGVATLMPVVCGLAYFIVPPLIATLVPRFEDATVAAQVLAMAVCLLAIPIAANTLLVAVDKENLVTIFRSIGSAVIVGLSLAIVRSQEHPPLQVFAWAAAAGYLVAGFLAVWAVLGRLYPGAGARARELGVFYGPTAWAVAVIYGLNVWGRLVPGLHDTSWVAGLGKAALFLLATAPVVVYADMRLKLRQELRRMVRELRARGQGPSAADEEKGE